MKTCRIATRQSQLALWQAEWVKSALQKRHPELKVEIIGMTTEGDRRLDVSLSKIGGKGLFVKELEKALLEGTADIAVHSLKDMPMKQPDGLSLTTFCQRHNPADVLLSLTSDIKKDATIGTSSFRRQCQIKRLKPNCKLKDLRGNVNTRIQKLIDGQYDAIILAAAAIERLGLNEHVVHEFNRDAFIPAAGQGALAIECRTDDEAVQTLLNPLNHAETETCITAERAVVKTLNGDCKTPIAAYATLENKQLHLNTLIGLPDASKILTANLSAPKEQAFELGKQAAEMLLADGAQHILNALS